MISFAKQVVRKDMEELCCRNYVLDNFAVFLEPLVEYKEYILLTIFINAPTTIYSGKSFQVTFKISLVHNNVYKGTSL